MSHLVFVSWPCFLVSVPLVFLGEYAGCVLPGRKFFWDPSKCGHQGFQRICDIGTCHLEIEMDCEIPQWEGNQHIIPASVLPLRNGSIKWGGTMKKVWFRAGLESRELNLEEQRERDSFTASLLAYLAGLVFVFAWVRPGVEGQEKAMNVWGKYEGNICGFHWR